MAVRFVMPYQNAFLDTTGRAAPGSKLYFYESETSTPKPTFSDPDLQIPNPFPVEANSGGRFGNIFLESGLYKVTLTDENDVLIWTADPLGSSFESVDVTGTFALSGIISPAQITSDQNNYNPDGLASSSGMRINSDAVWSITGIVGGFKGRILIVNNVGAFPITLEDESMSSTGLNRFALTGDITLPADSSIILQYDDASSRWRALSMTYTASGGIDISGAEIKLVSPQYQCRLTKVSTNLVLGRSDGTWLFINGANHQIPQGGVTLAPTGLTPDTLYYIYAYMNAGTMTLEAATTVPAADATYGNIIKTGDATRSLVGMAVPLTGPVWSDTNPNRLVSSFFNRRTIGGSNFFTTARTTTSTSFAEINSEIRVRFLVWADEAVQLGAQGMVNNATTSSVTYTDISIDGGTQLETGAFVTQSNANGSVAFPYGFSTTLNGLAIGAHYATIFGRVSAGTGTWTGSVTAGERCTLTIGVAG